MEAPKQKTYTLPSDAVWFITGCSSGMGKALAELVLAKNHRLVATARKLTDLSYLPDSPSVLKLALDVASPASIDAAIANTLTNFNRIDVLVNNAGYSLRGDTENASDSASRHLIDTNFWGPVILTKHALRIMRDVNPTTGQQGGVILNVSSMGGRIASPGNAFYHASKFALEGFTESVAKEVRPEWNIHFCLAEPGGVKTGYVSKGMQEIPPHEAYKAEDSPSRVIERYMDDPAALENWAEAGDVVERMYGVVNGTVRGEGGEEEGIPLRVPLGPDSWGMLSWENKRVGEELERWKGVALSVGRKGQFESIGFLRGE